ncbi:MAG TPA: hypothetical protein VK438_04540 [Xanthobacteraceae bacterium]|nr:hypothetical protein [Xanthobacteraceae bacterium]
MRRRLIVSLLALLPLAPASAQNIPQIDFERTCRELTRSPERITGFRRCVSDERSARDELARVWSSFAPADRRECAALTGIGGSPSYVQLLECLDMTREDQNERAKQ